MSCGQFRKWEERFERGIFCTGQRAAQAVGFRTKKFEGMTKSQIIGFIVVFVLGLIMFFGYLKYMDNWFESLDYLEYKESREVLVERHKIMNGIVLINQKISLSIARLSPNASGTYLYDLIQKGDLIVKKPYNDTLYVLRKNQTYKFPYDFSED